MRKFLSLIMAAFMLMSIVPFTLAEGDEENVVITKVSVTGAETTPTAGRTAGSMYAGTVMVNEYTDVFSIESDYWWLDTGNEETNHAVFGDDIFEEGMKYQHCWSILLNDGYVFADELEIEINGRTDNVEMYGIEDVNYMYFWSVSELATDDGMLHCVQIKNADLIPVIGRTAGELKKAEITADGGDKFSVTEDCWMHIDGEGNAIKMEDTESFAEGESYARSFTFAPADELKFADTTWISIDSQMLGCTLAEDGTVHTQTDALPAVDHIDIESVSVDDIDNYPVENDTAEYHTNYTLPDGARYSVSEARWFCNDDNAYLRGEDVFVAGKNYSFEIVLKADSDYLFTADAEFIPGYFQQEIFDTEKTGTDAEDATLYHVWTLVSECEKLPEVIDQIDVTGIDFPPVLGEKPTEHLGYTLPEDVHYTIETVCWFDDTTGMRMKDGDVYTIGHKYSMGLFVLADEGYVFEKGTSATLNGGTEILNFDASGYDRWDPCYYYIWTVSYEFPEGETEKIPEVSVSDIATVPVVGKTAGELSTYTIPEDAHYSVFRVTWYDISTEDHLAADDIFSADTEYLLEIAVVADTGYSFGEDVQLTLNGGTGYDADYSGYINDKVIRFVTYATAPIEITEPMTGDLNGDGVVNTADAVSVLKYAAEMTELDEVQLKAGDCNHDGSVNTGDAVLILKYAAGMITEF